MSNSATLEDFKRVERMLYNYKNTIAEIKILRRELEILNNDYRGVGSIGYDERTQSTNKFNSDVENEVIKRAESIQRLKNNIRLKEIEVANIDDAIDSLNDNDKYLINEYYIKNRQLKVISCEIGLAESYASVYKSNIINKLANLICTVECS